MGYYKFRHRKNTKMKTQKIYIFIDTICEDYKEYFGQECELELIKNLTVYLSDLSKTSKVYIITKQDISKMTDWLLKNDLYGFVDNIMNPTI